MADEPSRSRVARRAAEQALVRVVHHYGATPEFVLLGGLVPELLCSGSGMLHAGTTDVDVQVEVAAAYGRRKEKDWYDIAFVLLHNDAGGPEVAAEAVRDRFDDDPIGATRTALDDLLANFAVVDAQGPTAYAVQMVLDHPGLDRAQLQADAVVAVRSFYCGPLSSSQ